jgi:hypothetical protein
MNLSKRFLAASIGALPLIMCTQVSAATTELIIYPVMATVRTPAAANKSEAELNALDLVEEVVTGYELAYLVKTRMAPASRRCLPRHHRQRRKTARLASGSAADRGRHRQQPVQRRRADQYHAVGQHLQMKDATRGTGGTYGGDGDHQRQPHTSAGAVYTNTTNTWGDGLQYIAGGSTTNANGQTAAVNALWGLMNTYDMLKNTLGWQSLDGNNTATYIAAHVNTAYDNAYYSDTCKCMYIGDGGSLVQPAWARST